MPYDYPGEYAMRFDGVEVARFRRLVVLPPQGRPIERASKLATSGAGKLAVYDVGGVGTAGDLLLHRWQRSGLGATKPHIVTIEALDSTGAPVTRWRLRSAQPLKRVMKPHLASAKSAGGNEVAIETLEIAHEGIVCVD